jgi:Flp pilus assembly pilin Flp
VATALHLCTLSLHHLALVRPVWPAHWRNVGTQIAHVAKIKYSPSDRFAPWYPCGRSGQPAPRPLVSGGFPPYSGCTPIGSPRTRGDVNAAARRRLLQNSGQALVEYALILALTSLGIISALMILQGSLGNSMRATGQRIDAAAGGPAGQPVGGQPGAAGQGTRGDDGGYGTGGPTGHGNGKGNNGNGNGNGGPNGRK